VLPGDEACATRRAALFAIGVSKNDALSRYTVDIWCAVTHAAHVVGADIVGSNVVTPDNQYIGFVLPQCQAVAYQQQCCH